MPAGCMHSPVSRESLWRIISSTILHACCPSMRLHLSAGGRHQVLLHRYCGLADLLQENMCCLAARVCLAAQQCRCNIQLTTMLTCSMHACSNPSPTLRRARSLSLSCGLINILTSAAPSLLMLMRSGRQWSACCCLRPRRRSRALSAGLLTKGWHASMQVLHDHCCSCAGVQKLSCWFQPCKQSPCLLLAPPASQLCTGTTDTGRFAFAGDAAVACGMRWTCCSPRPL